VNAKPPVEAGEVDPDGALVEGGEIVAAELNDLSAVGLGVTVGVAHAATSSVATTSDGTPCRIRKSDNRSRLQQDG
jgi:hypothetical protein